jgi:hypothetical protein
VAILKRVRELFVICFIACAFALVSGCPKGGSAESSGSVEPNCSVSFEIYEAGTGNPLAATVWPVDSPDDYDNVAQGRAGAESSYQGIGRREGGEYALPFVVGATASMMVWSPGHELKRIDQKLGRGANLISIELRRTEVDDSKVPERIRTEVLESLPTEGPRTGS